MLQRYRGQHLYLHPQHGGGGGAECPPNLTRTAFPHVQCGRVTGPGAASCGRMSGRRVGGGVRRHSQVPSEGVLLGKRIKVTILEGHNLMSAEPAGLAEPCLYCVVRYGLVRGGPGSAAASGPPLPAPVFQCPSEFSLSFLSGTHVLCTPYAICCSLTDGLTGSDCLAGRSQA